VRALVLSDTHFGAWTGEDLLRHRRYLDRLRPHLDDVDEVIFLGDLFDLMFAPVADAFAVAEPLFDLLREKLQHRRFVFVPGNHDHHLAVRREEELRERELIRGGSPGAEDARGFFRRYLETRLDGVEVELRYPRDPPYVFGGVLLHHGHYLDPHQRQAGSRGSRALTQALRHIALGGSEGPRTVQDYEAVTTLLTELLYTVAQLPHGVQSQQAVDRSVRRLSQLARAPSRALRAKQGAGPGVAGLDEAEAEENSRRRRRGASPGGSSPSFTVARTTRPGDPQEHSLEAFAEAVANLGWAREADKVVFAHTHQPLANMRAKATGSVRYWNTGCWFYEPDLDSQQSYESFLRSGWPGTFVLIDTDDAAPRLVEVLADLNPLAGGPGLGPFG